MNLVDLANIVIESFQEVSKKDSSPQDVEIFTKDNDDYCLNVHCVQLRYSDFLGKFVLVLSNDE